MKTTKLPYGVLSDGTEVSLYTFKNSYMSFSATDYGCLLTSILLPAKTGSFDDILLGYSSLDSFVHRNSTYFGSLVGRYANRIQNAQFALGGKTYHLDNNDNGHSLHGGFSGYQQKIWKSEIVEAKEGSGVRFTRISPDGEQGYPGNLALEVCYLLNEKNELTLKYTAKTDADTPVNLTNHAYFNLKGHNSGTVARHIAQINSAHYIEVDKTLIPTGRTPSVTGTVFDFNTAKPLGKDFGSPELALQGGGYDVGYCFAGPEKLATAAGNLPLLATITEPDTGRVMTCSSDQPVMQLYTACMLSAKQGKNGADYGKYSAFCLETGQYTSAPTIPSFPQATVKAGETYSAVTVYAFR
jgi:aldose 1-epimerase